MSKKILLIASSCFLFFSTFKNVSAQSSSRLFQIQDSVCIGHEVIPKFVTDGAQHYSWTFCPPNLNEVPEGRISNEIPAIYRSNALALAQDENTYYAFALNTDSGLIKLTYADGYQEDPTTADTIALLRNARGMYAVQQDIWRIFVVEDDTNGFRLRRYDFINGLENEPSSSNLGSLDPKRTSAKELFIAYDKEKWFGFTFTRNDELLRLNFGSDITSKPSVDSIGNINNEFSGVSSLTGIVEEGNWHLFSTNEKRDNLVRIPFGNSLSNRPFTIDLGDMGGRLKSPVGLAITKSCQTYHGFVLNKGSASLVALTWDSTIYRQPHSVNIANVADFSRPFSLSGFASDSGALHLLAANDAKTISSMVFRPCTTSSIAGSEEQYPTFKYDVPGFYTIFLTVDEGLPTVRTDCKVLMVKPHPPIIMSNDTLICQGDTINLFLLTQGGDSTKWSPNYNINTVNGRFVKVWPEYTTEYTPTIHYDTFCIVKTSPITVNVSRIKADAGEDRTISDGSATMLGGPNTSLGEQYTYLWTPDIGIIASTGDPITKAVPPYDITYYLTLTNTDGCKVTDSVVVRTPCDRLNLPNAFVPGSGYANTNKFGILNQQFAKINYFKIFDRWGKEVFSTIDPEDKWDGKVDGNPAPLGVYVWEIDANCANTLERFRQSGTVTLIR